MKRNTIFFFSSKFVLENIQIFNEVHDSMNQYKE